jgi:hypothetical protein
MNLFGFEIKRQENKDKKQPLSFANPLNDDGAVNVETSATGGAYGYFLDIEGTAKNESELVTRYRSMALQPEVQQAIDEIVNEAISVDPNERVVSVVLDDTELPDKVKDVITEEFDALLRLFDFSNQGYDIFQRFFVDGRINYHVIIDEDDLKRGIVELRYLDPRKIRLIRENDSSERDRQTGLPLKKVKKEYYMYSEGGFGVSGTASTPMSNSSVSNQAMTGYRIAKDSIVRVTSGLMNENQSLVLSHLHKAIKPLNQLRILEDATVIYTLTRAPERRIFYVDVGNLPKAKAEQYLADMMARHKNKLQYDSVTGEMSDSRKFMTMTEDYWFPRREGSRATEVEPLTGGTSLADNDNLGYFQKKLFKSLGVPISRLEPETMNILGRSSEMSRDEIRFGKFVRRLRNRFSIIFDATLEKQLVLKGILTPEEWKEVKDKIRYDFMKDNYFEELKQMEILRERVSTLREVEEHVGKYFSRAWVQKNVLFMSDDEMREMQKEIDKEKKAGLYGDEMGDGEDDAPPGNNPPFGNKPDQNDDEAPEAPDDEELPAEESLKINKITGNKNTFQQFKEKRRKSR